MFVELIEQLRCPNDHEESALVATAIRTEHRHIVDGVLGCPVCRAEFPVRGGVAEFAQGPAPAKSEAPSQETAMRLAAFLDLSDARGFALLCGRWASHLEPLRQVTETPIVAVNPPSSVPVHLASGAIRGDVIPFAEGSARAFAIDEAATPAVVASGIRAVRSGGRVLGPATMPLPDGVTELVRDETMWVGVAEKTAAPSQTPRLVSLSRKK